MTCSQDECRDIALSRPTRRRRATASSAKWLEISGFISGFYDPEDLHSEIMNPLTYSRRHLITTAISAVVVQRLLAEMAAIADAGRIDERQPVTYVSADTPSKRANWGCESCSSNGTVTRPSVQKLTPGGTVDDIDVTQTR